MRTLSVASSAMAIIGPLARDDWMFILGVLVMVLNAVIEYLRYRESRKSKS